MQYVNLGSTGLKVSRICLGCMTYGAKSWREWVLDEEASRPLIRQALEAGVTFFDTADVYSQGVSEEILGRALKEFGPPREHLVVATKVHGAMGRDPNARGLSRKHIMQAIDASLRRLGMDYVDLYQIHRFDPSTPMEETLEALNDVVRAGKALHIGASSMYAWQFAKYLHLARLHGWSRFVTMQNHYNLLYREEEREMIPLCRDEGIGIIPWSPLARGVLAGNRQAGTARARTDEYSRQLYDATRDADERVVDRVAKTAEKLGVPPAQVALAWLLQKHGVTAPIIGASKPRHLDDGIAALDLSLSSEDIKGLEEPYVPHSVRGHG
ncbi:MAG: aldo/keto reductase [Reyranella sp.]|uniref:aldo/keto reductase n=1 Tax=Reyranella sp. TaxID=1929291 RepID=UPI0025E3CEC4|nr:aldo/keto reductase [Reyranella sp.]MBR2813628.1 aldo/keto reductase [Reyranella sp.]